MRCKVVLQSRLCQESGEMCEFVFLVNFFLPFWTNGTKAHTPAIPQNCNFDWKELKLGVFDVCNRLS